MRDQYVYLPTQRLSHSKYGHLLRSIQRIPIPHPNLHFTTIPHVVIIIPIVALSRSQPSHSSRIHIFLQGFLSTVNLISVEIHLSTSLKSFPVWVYYVNSVSS